MAAPTRPAPTPQPQPIGLACAWVGVGAIVPVAASAARASAAILVLIDIGNSIRLQAAIGVRMPVGRRLSESGSKSARAIRKIDYSVIITIIWKDYSGRLPACSRRSYRRRRAIRRTRAR